MEGEIFRPNFIKNDNRRSFVLNALPGRVSFPVVTAHHQKGQNTAGQKTDSLRVTEEIPEPH